MPAAAIVTIVITGLIVVAAAVGLFRVVMHLHAVARALDALIGGLGVVSDKTATVSDVVSSVNTNLKPVRDFAESV